MTNFTHKRTHDPFTHWNDSAYKITFNLYTAISVSRRTFTVILTRIVQYPSILIKLPSGMVQFTRITIIPASKNVIFGWKFVSVCINSIIWVADNTISAWHDGSMGVITANLSVSSSRFIYEWVRISGHKLPVNLSPAYTEKYSATFWRHRSASRWDPRKLTHFNGNFDEDSSSYLCQNTRWNYSIFLDPNDSLNGVVYVAEYFSV